MVTLRSHLSKEVYNATSKFSGLLTKPHQRNLRELVLGTIVGGSSHLTKVGKVGSHHVTPRKNTERLSRTLEKIETDDAFRIHTESAAQSFKDETVLLLADGGDEQKKYAQKIEGVCACVDGSEGHKTGWGFPTFAIMAYGTESHRQLPLCHHIYSTKEEKFKSEWNEQKQCYEWCSPFIHGSTKDRIIVEDRGGDDEKHFLYFRKELDCSFITRVQCGTKSRRLRSVDDGEMGDMTSVRLLSAAMQKNAGSAKTWKNKKLKKELTSTIAFQEVRLPKHPNLPLFLVSLFTEGFDEPLTILTDIDVLSFENAWRVFFFYKKRWEVENFFRAIKQEFGAEQFLVRTLSKIKGLAFVQVLAFSLLLKLKETLKELGEIVVIFFQTFCKREQRKKQSHLDVLHFLRQVFRLCPAEVPYRLQSQHIGRWRFFKPKGQLALFHYRKKW